MLRSRKGGFTLLELLVVVIIVGILAAIAIPQFAKTMEKSRISEANSILGSIRTAEMAYYQEKNTYTGTSTDLMVDVPADASTQHYFIYTLTFNVNTPAQFTATATRRIAEPGKNPAWTPPTTGGKGYTVTIDQDGNLVGPTGGP